MYRSQPVEDQIKGNQPENSDRHDHGVVLKLACLISAESESRISEKGRNSVHDSIDHTLVQLLPEQATDEERGPDKEEIVQFIEIPFIKGYFIEKGKSLRQGCWNGGWPSVEGPRHEYSKKRPQR